MENLGSIHRSEREGTILRSAHGSAGEIQAWKERCRLARDQIRRVRRRPALHVAFRGEIVYSGAEFVNDGRADGPSVIEHAALQRKNIVSNAVVKQRLTVYGRL